MLGGVHPWRALSQDCSFCPDPFVVSMAAIGAFFVCDWQILEKPYLKPFVETGGSLCEEFPLGEMRGEQHGSVFHKQIVCTYMLKILNSNSKSKLVWNIE